MGAAIFLDQIMTIDWRSLLTSIGVEWIDRGSNTSKGHVNIKCPWCGSADPSHHLAISEDTAWYYCRRASREHAGKNPERLLVELGVPRSDAFRLMRDFDLIEQKITEPKTPRELQRQWDSFFEYEMYQSSYDYMRDRGFLLRTDQGLECCIDPKYDLRYAIHGDHRNRVLFPIKYNGVLAGWTGRSIYDKTPIYKMEHGGEDGHVYLPISPESVMVVCEGPIDALKLVTALSGSSTGAVALLGKDIGPARLLRLQAVLTGSRTVAVCLDRDVSSTYSRMVNREFLALLRLIGNRCNIFRVRAAAGAKRPWRRDLGRDQTVVEQAHRRPIDFRPHIDSMSLWEWNKSTYQKWAHAWCHKNHWRVRTLYPDYEEAIQICCLMFCECVRRYGDRVDNPKWLMSLYTRMVINHWNRLATLDTRRRELEIPRADIVPENDQDNEIEPFLPNEIEPSNTSLLDVVLSLPSEIRHVLEILMNAPSDVIDILFEGKDEQADNRAIRRWCGIKEDRNVLEEIRRALGGKMSRHIAPRFGS